MSPCVSSRNHWVVDRLEGDMVPDLTMALKKIQVAAEVGGDSSGGIIDAVGRSSLKEVDGAGRG